LLAAPWLKGDAREFRSLTAMPDFFSKRPMAGFCPQRFHPHLLALGGLLLSGGETALRAASPVAGAAEDGWSFVSFPDFFNFDVPNPNPKWDDAIDWYLRQLKAENPRFSLVAGDLVNGHWWDSPEQIEHLANVYYGGWMRRIRDHGLLPVYTAVGDHELGDDPWPPEKTALVPDFRKAFADHMEHPENGPENFKERAYWIREGDLLVITVETFEVHDGEVVPTVSGDQLAWIEATLEAHADARFKIVQGHAAILPGARSRSSSSIYLKDRENSALWSLMAGHGVDAYFCGEFHAITCREHRGVWQVVHGASWGRVPTVNYHAGRVAKDTLRLELKRIPLTFEGGAIWNLHKGRGPREIVRITDEDKRRGFETVGTLTIDKSGEEPRTTERTGLFAE
jgi:hypothetical protein